MQNAPIFVKIDEHKEIIKLVDAINEKMDAIKTSLAELRQIKAREDSQMTEWVSKLDQVTEKMVYINTTLKEM